VPDSDLRVERVDIAEHPFKRQCRGLIEGREQTLNNPSAIDDPGSRRCGQLDPASLLGDRRDVRQRQLSLNHSRSVMA
jgi:hypothetical protein